MRSTGSAVIEIVWHSIQMYTRAVERGIGPTQYKDSFVFENLVGTVPIVHLEYVQTLPLGVCVAPFHLVISGVWWLTRGIEISAARVRHIEIHTDSHTVDWNLACSKTDPKALGAVRTHGCACAQRESSIDASVPTIHWLVMCSC